MSSEMKNLAPPDHNSPTIQELVIILTLTGMAFAIDVFVPLGVALGIFYVCPLLYTGHLRRQCVSRNYSVVATVLIIVGYWTSPEGGEYGYVLANRMISVVTVWVAYVIIVQWLQTASLHDSLQQQAYSESEKSVKVLQEKQQAILNLLEDMDRAKQAIEKSERHNRLIIEAAPSGMVIINQHGKIIVANKLLSLQFGYEQDELLGQSIETLLPERFREDHSRHRLNYLADPESRNMGSGRDLYALRKNGTEFPVEIGINPLLTLEGTFVLASVVDISERKKQEAALLQTMADLERSNQELDEFSHIIAHDLKEPLRGISNYSRILVEDYGNVLGEEGQSKCETLMRLSQRMQALIESLLDFSRAGHIDLAVGPTNLHQVLEDILESIDIRIKECNVDIRIPKDMPTMICDSVRIGEIFRNLITNAMKYNDKNEKWIEIGCLEPDGVETARNLTETRLPVFYVRDNGIGIREKDLQNVFRIFKRLHGRDKFGGGTGVGLSITQKLVNRQGGQLWVESTYGEGTTFFFTIKNGVEAERTSNQEEAVVI